MGWFDKKNKFDDDDADGTGMTGTSGTTPPRPALSQPPQSSAVPAAASQAPQPAQSTLPTPAAVPAGSSGDETGYGIDDVVSLMRELPDQNIELVVRVLKKTLESVKINIPGLIAGAVDRQADLTTRISALKKGIDELEVEIKAKRAAIGELETQHKEVVTVRERLDLAQKLDAPPKKIPASPTTAGATPAARAVADLQQKSSALSQPTRAGEAPKPSFPQPQVTPNPTVPNPMMPSSARPSPTPSSTPSAAGAKAPTTDSKPGS